MKRKPPPYKEAWYEVAETLNDMILNSPRYNHYVLGSGTIEDDEKWSVIRIQSSTPSKSLNTRDLSRADDYLIIANIIFRPDSIELYHVNEITTQQIDILDQTFLEKIIEWLEQHNIPVDHTKVAELL